LTVRQLTLQLPTAGAMPHTWRPAMTVGYGNAPSKLGLARPWGPESAAPAADGTWWFLDTAKHRLAHFDGSGRYLGEQPDPGQPAPSLLHVFRDGSMLAPAGQEVLVSDGTTARRVPLPGAGATSWTYDDGERAYARRVPGDRVRTVRLVDGRPLVETTDWFRTPHGERFLVQITDNELLVDLPDAHGLRLVFTVTSAEHPKAPVLAAVESAADEEGTLHLLVFGSTDEGGAALPLAGYLSIDRDGVPSGLDRMTAMQSTADPGSPAHLHVQPGTTTPSIVVIRSDAVRVYTQPSRFLDCDGLGPGDPLSLDDVSRCSPNDTQALLVTCTTGEYILFDRPGSNDIEGIAGVTPTWRRAHGSDPRYGRTTWAFQHCQETD
jgi:hypothetical protein